ncbi:hypothetical protein B0H16DRAFT_1733390 [Mycena metata]|uniref:RING-type domain-containing protein n=1 Tax=Mycena metata TaxID=1033252 RepID=A0AAD7MTC1_9AGAR|nr:hypothetical protein B0H16DRAFT_1733390 [Mycena metata]
MFPKLNAQSLLDLLPKLAKHTIETMLVSCGLISLILSASLLISDIFSPSKFLQPYGGLSVIAFLPPFPEFLLKRARSLVDKIIADLFPTKDTLLLTLLFLLPILSAFFIISLVVGSAKLAQARKFLLHGLIFVSFDLLPASVLTILTTSVSICAVFGALALYSIFVEHDCADISPHEPTYETQWVHHGFRIYLDTRTGTLLSVATAGLISTQSLLLAVIYYHRKYRRDLRARVTERLAAEKERTDATATIKRSVKQLSDVDASLVCSICVDRLSRPYTLAPCGHTFDLDCLQGWFRSAHPSPADEALALTLDPRGALFALRRKKFCPLCHGEVSGCPAPADALCGLEMQAAPAGERNVWAGLFLDVTTDSAV